MGGLEKVLAQERFLVMVEQMVCVAYQTCVVDARKEGKRQYTPSDFDVYFTVDKKWLTEVIAFLIHHAHVLGEEISGITVLTCEDILQRHGMMTLNAERVREYLIKQTVVFAIRDLEFSIAITKEVW